MSEQQAEAGVLPDLPKAKAEASQRRAQARMGNLPKGE